MEKAAICIGGRAPTHCVEESLKTHCLVEAGNRREASAIKDPSAGFQFPDDLKFLPKGVLVYRNNPNKPFIRTSG